MSESHWDGTERRTSPDRRASNRQGKYDRRRNRCMHCVFFSQGTSDEAGFCKQHQQPMSHDAFACWLFEEVPHSTQ